jgi:RP/EB family microtubule-associated protein
MLADGVAFAQIIDALNPGAINIMKVNLATRYPDDCLRNLRIVEAALKKLKITHTVSFEKISQGKFQDSITFLQWIYSYTVRCGSENL